MSHDKVDPRVFISYSWDSPEHKNRVLALSNRLRGDGVDCHIDQYEMFPSQGWHRWMEEQIDEAHFVLVACTEAYHERFRGKQPVGTGLGVNWEGAIISSDLYNSSMSNTKYVPVLFEPKDALHIPPILQSASRFAVGNEEGYDDLYRLLTNQPSVIKPALGSIKVRPPHPTPTDLWLKPSSPADDAALQTLIGVVSGNNHLAHILTKHDFANTPFPNAVLGDAEDMVEAIGQISRDFQDDSLESLSNSLVAGVEGLLWTLAVNTWTLRDKTHLSELPPEWRTEQPQRFRDVLGEISRYQAFLTRQYEQLMEEAQSRLIFGSPS